MNMINFFEKKLNDGNLFLTDKELHTLKDKDIQAFQKMRDVYDLYRVCTTNVNGKTFTRKEYINFMYNVKNIHNCKDCPENYGDDGWEANGNPCGQQNCWVYCHCNSGN